MELVGLPGIAAMTAQDKWRDKLSTYDRRELLTMGAVGAGSAALGVTAIPGTSLAGCTGDHECARTPGFWKNHTEMWHGVLHVHLGTADNKTDRYNYFTSCKDRPSALEILEMSPKGDKSIVMAQHLIATILNLRAGTDSSCIETAVQDAKGWFDSHPFGSNQRRWDGGESIKDRLDAYNNGQLCACGAD